MQRRSPLFGHRVLCVTASRAAALACGLLKAQGASPVFVDLAPGESAAPPGALVEAVADAVYTVAPDGTGALGLDELLGGVDVVIDPRPADAPAPPGWSNRELRSRCSPRVVYCALPPFSSKDEGWRARRASDELLAAMVGSCLFEVDGTPTLTALPVSACFAALTGALGIAAGLVARERYGGGQLLEVAELDATFLAMGARGLLVNREPGADRPSDPWGGPYRCQDGRWIWVNLATRRAVRRFAAHVGTLERWEREGLLGAGDLGASSPGRAELHRELSSLFEGRPASAWDELAVELGISLTAIRTLEEVRPDTRRGEDEPAPDDELRAAFGDERTVELLAVAEDAPAGQRRYVAWSEARPAGGAWALTPGVVAGEAHLPLSGVRVLDLTQMLAGPLAGRLLADLGAQVVKINDPDEDGAGYRWQENRYHTDVNRGKATLLVDLTRPEGRAIAERLVAEADVVLENVRSDAARRLGVDEARLRGIAPALCHAHISAFSLDSRWDAPGYEPNGQAIAGLMSWSPDTGAPRMQPFAVNDYGTGLLGALGVTLALYHQLRDGGPSYVGASLSRTAFFYARAMADAGRLPTGPGAGGGGAGGARSAAATDAGGRPLSSCLWRLRDGWIVVDGPAEPVTTTLWSLVGPDEAGGQAPGSEQELRARVGRLDADEVLGELAGVGLVASRLRSTQWQARRSELAARGLVSTYRYADDYVVSAVGNPIQLNGAPLHRGLWVARPGKDGPALLEALGLSRNAVEQLLADRVVAIG